MLSVYRLLLWLYPADHRSVFGDEMIHVFLEAKSELRKDGILARMAFSLHECLGLIRGAVVEQIRTFYPAAPGISFDERRSAMRSQFRFSWLAIFFMAASLLAAMTAIWKGESVILQHAGLSTHLGTAIPHLASQITLVFILSCFAGVLGWLIALAIGRTGIHHLSKSKTLPQR